MEKLRWFALAILLAMPCAVSAHGWRVEGHRLKHTNSLLAGKVIDHTANSGEDYRMWSRSLWQRRDLYVYLPPGYNPNHRYPVMIWMHDFLNDERTFVHHIVPVIDDAIASGKLPPLIVAAPDGTLRGVPDPLHGGSFFLNTPHGPFADFVLHDVWDFVCKHYPIRSERQAHIVAGAGMGGFAAYNHAIKHREAFGNVIGIMPALNIRWMNKYGHCHADFHPRSWGWMTKMPHDVSLKHALSFKTHCISRWFASLYAPYESPIRAAACENPIEMIDRYRVQPGQLEMFVGYAPSDNYNIDAQVQSFLYLTRWRGLRVAVAVDEYGKHTNFTAARILPSALQWLAPRIPPFSPTCPETCAPVVAVSCPEYLLAAPPPTAPATPGAARAPVCRDGSCRYPQRLPPPQK